MTSQVYNYDDTELRELVKKIQTQGLSIHHEQEFTEDQIVEFFKRIGECAVSYTHLTLPTNREV